MSMRVVAGLCVTTLYLSACSPPPPPSFYRAQQLTLVRIEAGDHSARPAHHRPRIRAAAPAPATASRAAAQPTSVLHPVTPQVGSPEWEREQAMIQRREQQMKDVIRSICTGC